MRAFFWLLLIQLYKPLIVLMIPVFEELDYQDTPLGEISLRRRSEPRLDHQIIYEVKLGDEFLMSSLFVEAEEQLSKLAISELIANGLTDDLDIVVGGLGLGYTALAVLDHKAVKSLSVIDVMEPVIRWHQEGILPIGKAVAADSRCQLVLDDFFTLATAEKVGFDQRGRVHAVLLDIDHSPSHWLNDDNKDFYSPENLQKLSAKLLPKGVFGLWSNEPEDRQFTDRLSEVFVDVKNYLIEFPNPYSGGVSTNSIYLATRL